MLNLGKVDGTTSGDFNLERKEGFYNFHKTFEDTWLLIADTSSQTDDDVAGDPTLPFVGQFSARGGFCVSKKAKERETVIHPITGVITVLWEVNVKFDSNIDADQADNSPNDPTSMRPKRRWRREKIKERQVKDAVTGDAIITKAGEEMVVEHDVGVAILEIQRYEAYPFSPTKMYTYGDHTNDGSFYGAPSGCALMDDIQVEEEIINNGLFSNVTYVIKFKFKDGDFNQSDGWKGRLLHQGYLYLPFFGAGFHQAITKLDKNGNPIKVNLESTGELLLGNGQPNYIEYNEFPKASFSALNLEF